MAWQVKARPLADRAMSASKFMSDTFGKTIDDLDRRFTYHPPKDGQSEIYAEVRAKAKELASLICYVSKPSREQALAVTKVEEAVMWCNAGIARNG